MSHNILIAGCGGIGLQLALTLSTHHQVYGLKRNAASLPNQITPISADLTDPSSLRGKLPSTLDYVVYCLSAPTFSDQAYRDIYVTGLNNLLNEIQQAGLIPRRLFFVSSTSVYQQDDNEWVNEETPVAPGRFSGLRMLEAEQRAIRSDIPATIVRFSGIYGGHRTRLLEQVKQGTANSHSTSYTNRIHEDDCVLILQHLIALDQQGRQLDNCYLASDSAPVRMCDLVAWLSEQLHHPSPQDDQHQATKDQGKRRAGSKRCCNKQLLATGYHFKYPTFKEGYKEMIDRVGDNTMEKEAR